MCSLGALEKLLVAAYGGFGLSALQQVSDPCFGSPKATAPRDPASTSDFSHYLAEHGGAIDQGLEPLCTSCWFPETCAYLQTGVIMRACPFAIL